VIVSLRLASGKGYKGTAMGVDLHVAKLLSSRLCHDLVGPVGAVNSGLELLQEGFDEGPDEDGRALALVVRSADEANRRLAFYRVAFGFGAGAKGQATLDEAGTLAAGFMEYGKITLDWPSGYPQPVKPDVVKVLLNMVLMAMESLPRGGGVGVTASGESAVLRDDLRQALAEGEKGAGGENGALSARNVHAYFAQCMARDLGGLIEHSEGQNGEIQFAVIFPDSAD
jgi:histidine phosphotransferase ChpT